MTKLNLEQIFTSKSYYPLITGPCSAESPEQLEATAAGFRDHNINLDYFRSGVWKPRTRPNSFEGVGEEALKWLADIRDKYGYKIITEVANTKQVEAVLDHNIDAIWIGARTTVNPFTVQEIAEAIKGVDIPVFIKNPINPDLGLWIGAIERIAYAGVKKISAIHRGFSEYKKTEYRNAPQWQIPIDLMQNIPEIEMLIDTSHILGQREGIARLAQFALDLGYHGFMIESHYAPDIALSDSAQQITPHHLRKLLNILESRSQNVSDVQQSSEIQIARKKIDKIDREIIDLFSERMMIADSIGTSKRAANAQVFQKERYQQMLANVYTSAKKHGLSEKFVTTIIKAAHQEAIERQKRIYELKNGQKNTTFSENNIEK